ncbi:MAG: DNA repair protein RecO [Phormidesmis sp. RL_2_1]|nr:DNA repair protein RecO [Phormidesmis sp. RL_2_1]
MTQRSYKATGINLKSIPMGESDRLVTVLTPEKGLVRAIAPGARKHKSKLAGRSGLFVINDLLFIKGKSLDKLIQAETQRSFPGLSGNLAKLTASQYLAEIALAQALSDQPQTELYALLVEHLVRLETATKANILPCLTQATFHLLALAGVAPEVFRCCLSRAQLSPDISDPNWQVAFSVTAGGIIAMAELKRLEQAQLQQIAPKVGQHLGKEESSKSGSHRQRAKIISP